MVKRGEIGNSKNSKVDRELQVVVSKKIDKAICERGKKANWLRAFSVFGLIGWSVGVPVVILAYIGIWVEKHYSNQYISWPLYFVLFGLVVGCYNAFRFMKVEKEKLEKENCCNVK